MLINKSGYRAFNEYDLSLILENQLKEIRQKIESDLSSKSFSPTAEYISRKTTEGQIKPVNLKTDDVYATTSEQMIPTEYFPSAIFFMDEHRAYKKEVLTFHLPFSGDPVLLRSVPNPRLLRTEEIGIIGNEILFDVINFNNDSDTIQKEKDNIINFLKSQLEHVNNQVNGYNNHLEEEVKKAVEQAKVKLSTHDTFLSKLGVSIKSEKESHEDNLQAPTVSHVKRKDPKNFDVFICYASEDKQFVISLAEASKKAGIEVWYDGFQLGWGDDLRSTIDEGLKNSLYGIVIFSKSFLEKKKWTEYELNGLFAREKPGKKIILPIWHNVTREEVAAYSPSLADRFAKSSSSIDEIVLELKNLLKNR
ncbi:toll/interleukin-1 receptor domain-containing protein [Patescibacteria group bacterium]|nr:toll/interleukin-1 receptor domain-containing protein [Patescibacteria group bacterium]